MDGRESRVMVRAGAFVLAALLLLVAFILAIGNRSRWFEERYTLRAAFRQVARLMVGAPVRLAGVTVGRVAGIGFGPDPADERITVELSVDRRYRHKIREDSVATISTIYTKLLQNGDQIVTNVNKLAASLAEGPGLLHALAYDPKGATILADLAQSAADLRRVTGKLARGEGTLGALLHDATLYEDLATLVRGAERSWILRTLIRSSVRRGESAK